MSKQKNKQIDPNTTSIHGRNTLAAKRIFFFSLAAMLLLTWISGYNIGFHVDEMDMNTYCKANYAYYLSGGKDKSFLEPGGENEYVIDSNLRFYGSAFEYIPVGFNKITGLDKGTQEFNSRHIFIQLFGIIAILFAGLIAAKLSNWRAAIFTEWLLFLTPTFFGSILFNTKDIPFCTGYIASIYFIICFLEELPTPSWKMSLFLLFSFAFTSGTRIGGLLLIFYLLLFVALFFLIDKNLRSQLKENIVSLSAKLVVIILGCLCLVTITWPFLLQDPIHNLSETLNVVKRYPVKIKLNFDGAVIDSLHLPPFYLIKFMSITIPLFIQACIIISIILLFLKRTILNRKYLFLILFTSVFPIIYAMLTKAALYSGWRHFLFIYPGFIIIAGIGLNNIFETIKRPVFKGAFFAICLLAMIKPIAWSFNNHPYEYAYFNESVGGFKNAYYNYETDYWEITVKKAVDWLMTNEPIAQSNDTVRIATNTYAFLDYYIQRHYPGSKVKVVSIGCVARSIKPWTYGVFNTIFLGPDYLANSFPPGGTIHTVNIDGLPVTAVIKDTNRFDLRAMIAFQDDSFAIADSLFSLYMQTVGNNAGIYGIIGFNKALLDSSDAAIKYCNLSLEINKDDFYAFEGLGLAYLLKDDYDKGISYLLKAKDLKPDDELLNRILKNAYIKQQAVINKMKGSG
ncbi:MAG TPA: glycosyltransferase family 39 protein [Flavipsychrobacter sp.]|nr:glycosyltransferase family 39 protein [Flavipsychrobacter sp.]